MSTSSQIPKHDYSTVYLNSVIGCIEPMPIELADAIRCLHKDHGLDYEAVPPYLTTGNTTAPGSWGAGKMLVELAALRLGERHRDWS